MEMEKKRNTNPEEPKPRNNKVTRKKNSFIKTDYFPISKIYINSFKTDTGHISYRDLIFKFGTQPSHPTRRYDFFSQTENL